MIQKEKRYCDKCKKEVIPDTAYIEASGVIVMFNPLIKRPPLYTCPEQAENYSKKLMLHSICWISLLREYGLQLHDMNEVAKKYTKKEEKTQT
jgi:hypothetical protein